MAYVPVPKDLTKVKSKVMFGLTKRQLICFGSGAIIGVPLFFLLRDSTGTSAAAIVMIISMLPFFIFGLYEKNDQPLEVVLRNVIQTLYVHPQYRPYQTNNLYSALMRQYQMEQEVKRIVKRTKPKAYPR